MSATEVRDRTSEIIILKYDSFVTADSIVASGKTDGTEYSRACSVYDVLNDPTETFLSQELSVIAVSTKYMGL
jgi:hypothetical protein